MTENVESNIKKKIIVQANEAALRWQDILIIKY